MEYILQNWSELNLIDRAWFLAGAWLLFLFLGIFAVKILKSIFIKKTSKESQKKSANSPSSAQCEAKITRKTT